jgi:A/G-specific adenine glycosylase
MTVAEPRLITPRRAPHFRRRLLGWYDRHRREYPWRRTADSYAVWVSEVMLQQTRTSRVTEYFGPFLQRFPDVQALAAADRQQVLKAWEMLGYYARARNLHTAAMQVVREYGGKVPVKYEQFRALPGVGDYTAAAVTSIADGQPRAVVDGNVKRVLARLLLLDVPVNSASSLPIFQERAAAILHRGRPGDFNQAMMEFGARICRPHTPCCDECPVTGYCGAFQTGRQSEFPVRLRRAPTPLRHVAVGIVRRGEKILITRRAPAGLLGGLWEFPGGGVRNAESPKQACRREILEETGLAVEVEKKLLQVRHAYSHFRIVMNVFLCRYLSGRVKLSGPVDHRWIRPQETGRFPFPAANHRFLHLLKDLRP